MGEYGNGQSGSGVIKTVTVLQNQDYNSCN